VIVDPFEHSPQLVESRASPHLVFGPVELDTSVSASSGS